MKILEQLWYGTLRPTEMKKPSFPQYSEVLDTANKSEEKLISLLTDEGKELFDKLNESRIDLYAMDECEIFMNGFRMGARLMLEIMENTDK